MPVVPSLIKCHVCVTSVPREFAHEHHERPQAAGGTDEDIIFLCSGCHNNVHQIANMLMGPKAGQAEATIKSFSLYAASLHSQRRCMQLAMEVVKWLQLKRAGQLKSDENEDVEVVMFLPLKIRNALQAEADAMRHPKSGRRVGMSRLATNIVSDWVYRKYPKLRNT